MNHWRDNRTGEDGAGLVEYAPIIIIVAVLVIAMLSALRGEPLGLLIFFAIILLVGSWMVGWYLIDRRRNRSRTDVPMYRDREGRSR